jgi:hypothetical protein
VSDTPTRLKVVDDAGRPVSDATVAVVRSSVPFPEIALLADGDGVVEVRLPEGSFTFRAHGPGGRSGQVTLSSPASGEVVIRLTGRQAAPG